MFTLRMFPTYSRALVGTGQTALYFHDGQVKTLEEAVRLMGQHPLGWNISENDVKTIVAFLGSLTGTIDQEYIAMPKVPPRVLKCQARIPTSSKARSWPKH